MRMRALGSAVVAVFAFALAPAGAAPAVPGAPAPSEPVYGIKPPVPGDPAQWHAVDAADGTDIVVETWLPAEKDGHVPPARVPVIVSISPYLGEGIVESSYLRDTMVPRGYAYANVHVRGTGLSGGCIDLFGATEADDSARAIEYLGRDAPFSDGNVGGYGISYPGGTLLSVAGRGDPEKTKYLKAIVSGAPYHSLHEAQWMFDGVPSFVVSDGIGLSYGARSLGFDFETYTPPPLARIPERIGCQPLHDLYAINPTGDHDAWHRDRDNRAWTDRITVPTFLFHGHADLVPLHGSPPSIEVGLFDQLPASTPKFGMFGVWGHQVPPVADFTGRMIAWFERYLRGVDTGVEAWPTVRVQGNDGQWFDAPDWPDTGGAVQRLPIGPATYTEAFFQTTEGMLPGTYAQFDSGPLPDGLEIVGQPVLDLWLELSLPDAHIAARIDTFDAAGHPIANGFTYGLRSAQHLEPYDHGRFVQAHGVPAPVLTPVHVPVRFQPTALVVPPGGSVRIVIAGSVIVNPGLSQFGIPEPFFMGPSQPSGVPTTVTILQDAEHPSALVFQRR